MSRDRFKEIQVGASAEIIHEVTESDVDAFCRLTGDDNPLHMDSQYAETTNFKKRVVHGMLTASFISTLIGTKLPGKGALWFEQHLRFLAPVRIGEKIRVTGKVLQKSEAQRILTIETEVYNSISQKVIEGIASVKVLGEKKKGDDNMRTNETYGAVIVTGASRGIGAAVTLKLAEQGYPVVINCSNSTEDAECVKKKIVDVGGRAIVYKADAGNAEQVATMVDEAVSSFGTLAGIVHCASAPNKHKMIEELTAEDFRTHLDIHLMGAHNLFTAALPHFAGNEKGVFVAIGSTACDGVPPVKDAHYIAGKSALISYTKCIAAEYGPKGIVANCVSPGLTLTQFTADMPEKAKMITKMQTPLRRLGAPEDIAGVVAFLFTPEASYITGQNISVCGGNVM